MLSEEAERVYVIEWMFTLWGRTTVPDGSHIVQMDVRACSQSTSSPTRFKRGIRQAEQVETMAGRCQQPSEGTRGILSKHMKLKNQKK